MKKLTKVLLPLLALLFISVSVVFAADAAKADTVVSLQIDNPTMQVNGTQTQIDQVPGTTPVIRGGRTLVPIRAIIEAFGGQVGWDNDTRTVTLTMDDDIIKLVIDNRVAHFNGTASTLDVSPTIINGRTMLPIRYIAESFNLGVGWNDTTRTVYIVRNYFDANEQQQIRKLIPTYDGQPYVEINGNTPFFKEHEIIDASFEFYADLDALGRCNIAMSSVGADLMPTDTRENISSVTPTGWINNTYDFIDGGYLYNRCHLIGFQLTGENANERNLITGTRYLNISGMLPFENKIDDYVEATNNNVIYRVTPIFNGNNLLADGVLLEAYSVEDNGAGISFCVYCYNVQPYVSIDYATGSNSASGNAPSTSTEENKVTLYALDGRTIEVKESEVSAYLNVGWYRTLAETQQTLYAPDGRTITVFKAEVSAYKNVGWYETQAEALAANKKNNTSSNNPTADGYYYRTPTGKRYHLDPNCGGKNSYRTTNISGLTPCAKCAK